jgi:hypothetical protein
LLVVSGIHSHLQRTSCIISWSIPYGGHLSLAYTFAGTQEEGGGRASSCQKGEEACLSVLGWNSSYIVGWTVWFLYLHVVGICICLQGRGTTDAAADDPHLCWVAAGCSS